MTSARHPAVTVGAGAGVGVLGGLIGLGGAEFRLPLLLGLFRFPALEAVMLNKACSLVVVAVALPARLPGVPFRSLADRWDIIAILLSGSLVGAWFGAGWAVRLRGAVLTRVIAVLLAILAVSLLLGHDVHGSGHAALAGAPLVAVGVVAGFAIGVVAALMGVAGGELLIPTCVLLFGVDLKLAGSLSMAVSLPTMLMGFARYSRDPSFVVIGRERRFLGLLCLGSLIGVVTGGLLLGLVPTTWLLGGLSVILAVSAIKTWNHAHPTKGAS